MLGVKSSLPGEPVAVAAAMKVVVDAAMDAAVDVVLLLLLTVCGIFNRRYNDSWRHKNDGVVEHGGKMEAALWLFSRRYLFWGA